jgi:hypothetical protein
MVRLCVCVRARVCVRMCVCVSLSPILYTVIFAPYMLHAKTSSYSRSLLPL